jgi:pyruvate dehydrogenase E2 component (dihydrolipoamide acetyltransferase)
MKKDIETHSKSSASINIHVPMPLASASERTCIEPLSQIRKTIARNMLRSKQNTAHMSIMDEVEVSELVAARARLNEALADKGIRLSYLPFIIKAITLALKDHPILNAELDMDNERIIYKNYYNIGIAMDTPEGLVVPVIKDADSKSLIELTKDLKDLMERAQERKLTLNDLKDGTFSITSYGSIGGYFAVPVIAYPQVAIFGVGRLSEKPIVKNHELAIGQILPISMSVDHRIVDGAEVSRFVNQVLSYLKEPLLLLAHEGGTQ